MPPTGFEPTISAGERPQTYALDRTATGPAVRLIQSRDFQTAVHEEIMELLFCNNYYLETLSVLFPIPVAAQSKTLACWGCGFESRRGHGCMSVVNVVFCQVEVCASS